MAPPGAERGPRPIIDLPTTLLFTSVPEQISSFSISLLDDGEASKWAAVDVSREWRPRAKTDEAFDGTVMDPRLGKESGGRHRSAHCALCGFAWRRCMGHFGVRKGAFLLNPALCYQLVRVMGAIAPTQSPFAAPEESGLLLAYHANERARSAALAAARRLAPEKRAAFLRQHTRPHVRGKGEARRELGVRWMLNFRTGTATAVVAGEGERIFSVNELLALLSRLTSFDLETLGVQSVLGLVFRDLPILPTPTRPTTLRNGSSVPNPYTRFYNRVVGALRREEEVENPDRDMHALASKTLSELVWPKALGRRRKKPQPAYELVPKSIGESLKGKEGDMRNLILGKRAFDTIRSNIIPDCSLRHGQVGIPAELARLVDFAEPCNAWSRANTLSSHRGGRYMTELHKVHAKEGGEHEDGNIILRSLKDGDLVLLNRQPTLSNCSMLGMEVVILPGKAIRIPPNYGPTFHADFDGDEMNIFIFGSVETATEARMLTSLPNALLSDATSRPCVALHQDAVLGIHLLTSPGVRLSRQEVLRLTSATGHPMVPRSSLQAPFWAGRDALEVAFVHLGFGFSYSSGCAEVRGGRLVRGPLRKAHVGTSEGGLVHCVARTLGGKAALTLLDRLMDLANEFLLMRPPCMTAADILLGQGTPVVHPDKRMAKQFTKCRDAKDACDIAEDIAVRAHRERVTEPMQAGVKNTFTLLVSEVKCKGSDANLCQQYGAVGLQTVGGRLPPKGCTKRTLPLFGRATAKKLEANGYVAEALADGLSVPGNYFHTWSARSGLVDGRLNTPISGYQQRNLIAPAKNCLVAHDGTVRSENEVIQFCYGGDGAIPRRAVSTGIRRESLCAARAEAEEDDNAALLEAVDTIENAGRAAGSSVGPEAPVKLSLPVPVDWIISRHTAGQGLLPVPGSIDSEAAMLLEGLNALRPWEPSKTTRAVLLVLLRRSERIRLGITARALTSILQEVKSDWNASRVPAGMPVGVFLGTSVGPPATQGSLDAFHTAGMHRSGGGNLAGAFEKLLKASRGPGSGGMVVYLHTGGSEPQAHTLAERLPQRTVGSSMPKGVQPRLAAGELKAEALLAAYAAVGKPAEATSCVLVRLCPAKVPDPMAFAFLLEHALRLRVMPWPLQDASFVLVEAKSAKQAMTLVRSLRNRPLSGVPDIVAAYPARALDGSWTVETQGSNLRVVLGMPEVDSARTFSRCTRDTAAVLGVEAAVRCAFREVKKLIGLSGVDRRHLSLMADFMMRTGIPLPFTRHGMKAGNAGALARSLYETPLVVLGDAALSGTEDPLTAITSQIFAGRLTNCGTGYSRVLFDTNAIAGDRERRAVRRRREERAEDSD